MRCKFYGFEDHLHFPNHLYLLLSTIVETDRDRLKYRHYYLQYGCYVFSYYSLFILDFGNFSPPYFSALLQKNHWTDPHET